MIEEIVEVGVELMGSGDSNKGGCILPIIGLLVIAVGVTLYYYYG